MSVQLAATSRWPSPSRSATASAVGTPAVNTGGCTVSPPVALRVMIWMKPFEEAGSSALSLVSPPAETASPSSSIWVPLSVLGLELSSSEPV